MTQQIKSSKSKTSAPKPEATSVLLSAILQKLRLLRKEVALLFPYDQLEKYEHADRIKQSYQNAAKAHPPIPYSWK